MSSLQVSSQRPGLPLKPIDLLSDPYRFKMWASTRDAHRALKIRLAFYSVLRYTILFKEFLLGDPMQYRLASFA